MRLPAVIPWIGGKNRQAANITPIFHEIARDCYVEPFGGSAAMFCNKKPEKYEVYNDLNGLLVNLFRVLRRKDAAREFEYLASITPHCRAFWNEFKKILLAAHRGDDAERDALIKAANLGDYDLDVVLAFLMLYCQRLGFGGTFLHSFGAGSAGSNCRSYAQSYKNAVDRIADYTRRFDRVTIENLDAFECITKYDAPETLLYIDPPYDIDASGDYKSGWTTNDSRRLVDALKETKSSVVLSCYDSTLYQELFDAGYNRRNFYAAATVDTVHSGHRPRTETVYYKLSQYAERKRQAARARALLFQ